jgi:hypothetical protein
MASQIAAFEFQPPPAETDRLLPRGTPTSVAKSASAATPTKLATPAHGYLGAGGVIGVAATALVVQLALATICMYESVATGYFTSNPINTWFVLYGSVGVSSFLFSILAGVDYFTKPRDAVTDMRTASHSRHLWIVCMIDIIAILFVVCMLGVYSDQYNNDSPFTSASTNSNPRDRLSAWRSIHLTGLIFSVFCASAMLFIIADTSPPCTCRCRGRKTDSAT